MWQFLGMLIGIALMLIVSFMPLIKVDFIDLTLIVSLQTLVFGISCFLFSLALRYGRFQNLPLFQKITNYVALVFLFVVASVGGAFGLMNLFLVEPGIFIPLLPVDASLTLLIGLLQISFAHPALDSLSDSQKNTDCSDEADLSVLSENTERCKQTENSNDKLLPEVEILDRIAVKTGQKIHVIMVPEIVSLIADGDYVQIYTEQGKYLKEQTMKYFEVHLPTNDFVRVHRSCIINVEAVLRIDLYANQNQKLTMKNGQQIKTSQAGYRLLRKRRSL